MRSRWSSTKPLPCVLGEAPATHTRRDCPACRRALVQASNKARWLRKLTQPWRPMEVWP